MVANSHPQSGTFFPGPEIRRRPVKGEQQTHIRQPIPVEVPDIEKESGKYVALGLVALHKALGDLANRIDDFSRPFDEYAPQTLSPEAENTILLQPQWEVSERVEEILITGPAGAVTIQLGDRLWTLTIPAAGFLLIAPVAIYLERNDVRQLTATVAGQFTFELMGHADARGALI